MTITAILSSKQFLGYLGSFALLGWAAMSLLVAFGLPADLGAVARAAGVLGCGAFAALYVVAFRGGSFANAATPCPPTAEMPSTARATRAAAHPPQAGR